MVTHQAPTKPYPPVFTFVTDGVASAIEQAKRHLTIADTGRWKPPGGGADLNRGRGTALMRALMSKLTITPGPDGTTVHMHTRIGS
ncbi:hypothetical protein GCM10023178_23180 [Actinomadura luteofluorescens]